MASKYSDLLKPKEPQGEIPVASGQFMTRYLAAHYQKVENIKRDLQRLPEKEEFFFLQTDKQFNAFTFIPYICETQSIKHLQATTYSINKRVINSLIEMHQEGLIDKVTLLVSDTMLSRNTMVSDLLAATGREYANFDIRFAWVHAKVCLLRTKSAYYVVEGSGNWSENAQIEQYTVANSEGLYRFREKLITETQLRHRVLNGEIVKI